MLINPVFIFLLVKHHYIVVGHGKVVDNGYLYSKVPQDISILRGSKIQVKLSIKCTNDTISK